MVKNVNEFVQREMKMLRAMNAAIDALSFLAREHEACFSIRETEDIRECILKLGDMRVDKFSAYLDWDQLVEKLDAVSMMGESNEDQSD